MGELPTFSDHCPLYLAMDLSIEQNEKNKKETSSFRMYPLIQPLYWSDQVRTDYDQAISENDVTIQAIKDRLNIDPLHVLTENLQGMLITFVQGRKKNALNSLKVFS